MEAYSRRKNRNIPWNVYTLIPKRKDSPSAIAVEAISVKALLVTNPFLSMLLLSNRPIIRAVVAMRIILNMSKRTSVAIIFSATKDRMIGLTTGGVTIGSVGFIINGFLLSRY